MTTDSKPSTGNAGGRRGLHGGAALLVVALILGVLLLLVDFREERPDYQESARVPLTEAARALEESYDDESLLLENFKTVHERLNSAIALLGQAERLDPEDKRQIEVLYYGDTLLFTPFSSRLMLGACLGSHESSYPASPTM